MYDNMIGRALAAWFRTGGTDSPASDASGISEVGGLHYAVLRNANGVLAVYRIETPEGGPRLRRLKRWPKELETW